MAYGKEKSKIWLQILNDHFIGPNHKYLVGNQLTVADYFGAAITTAGGLVHCDFSAYSNIKRWLDTFEAGPNYAKSMNLQRLLRLNQGTALAGDHLIEGSDDQGFAPQRLSLPQFGGDRKFYEDFLGLPLVNAFKIEPQTGRKTGAGVLHSFFHSTTARPSPSSRRPTCRSSSRSSTTSTCTSRSRSSPSARRDVRQGQGGRP